jgi:uncharacterized membrane protein
MNQPERISPRYLPKLGLLILLVVVVMSYNFIVFTTHNSIAYADPSSDLQDIPLAGQVVEQHFFANEPVRTVDLVIYQEEGKSQGKVRLEATLVNDDSDETLDTDTQTIEMTDSAERVQFHFKDTLTQETNEFAILLKMPDKDKEVFLKATEKGYSEKLYLNDSEAENLRLVFKVSYQNNLMLGFFIFTLILLTVSLACLFFPRFMNIRPHQLFVVLALICGLGMAFISPSGQEPDVGDHILRAFDVSYGNILPVFRQTNEKTVQMPTNFSKFDDRVLDPGLNQGLSRTRHLQNTYFASGESGTQTYRYKAGYSTVLYLPQGLGLYLGRVLHWNSYEMIILARVLNLLAFIFLTQLAIRTLPTLKNTLMVIALMPITLAQASSLSADAMINGLSFLFVALVIQLAIEKPVIKIRSLLPSLLCLYFVVLAKPIYILLILLYLVIPYEKRIVKWQPRTRRLVWLIAGSALVAAILFGFAAGWLDLAENKAVYSSQLEFVMHNLATTLRIFFHTLDVNAFQYISWLNMLGWLNYSLGILIVAVPAYLLLVGLAEEQPYNWSTRQRVVLGSVFVLSVAGIFIGLYVFDIINSIGADLMIGAQGRYFIPLFILPFLAIRRPLHFSKPDLIAPRLAGISGLMLTYTLYTLTRLIY